MAKFFSPSFCSSLTMSLDIQEANARLNSHDIAQQVFQSSNWIISHHFMATCKKFTCSLPNTVSSWTQWCGTGLWTMQGPCGQVTSQPCMLVLLGPGQHPHCKSAPKELVCWLLWDRGGNQQHADGCFGLPPEINHLSVFSHRALHGSLWSSCLKGNLLDN